MPTYAKFVGFCECQPPRDRKGWVLVEWRKSDRGQHLVACRTCSREWRTSAAYAINLHEAPVEGSGVSDARD